MRSLLIAATLLIAAIAVPAASAAHECEYQYVNAVGVEAYTCSDDEGRPHWLMVKDETLGGVMLGHPFFSEGHELWGNDFQYTSATVWTYSNTPTGQTWFTVWNWCGDAGGDGSCDDTWTGASVYFRGVVWVQPHVSRSYDGQWYACVLAVSLGQWICEPIPSPPVVEDGLPVMPTLP